MEAMLPAVAVNLAVSKPRMIFTRVGTVSRELLLESRICRRLDRMFEAVTVQVVEAPEVRVVGEQESEATYGVLDKLMVAVAEVPL